MMEAERDDPIVTVVLPVFNMAEYVDSAVDSVLEGDFDPVEVIVVDDGSTDETEELLSRYVSPDHSRYDPRVRYVSQPNRGKAAAVNHGFSLASGSFVTILDADDELTSDSLAARYRKSNRKQSGEAVIGGFEVFDEEESFGTRHPPEEAPETLRRAFYLRWRTPFHLNTCLFSIDLVDRVGPMDERFRRCLDGDYAMRLLDAVDTVSVVPSVVYRYRKHRSSRLERLRTRVQTARYRVRVSWKNYRGWRKWWAVPFGLALDAGKFGYELVVGNYKQ